MTPLRQVPRLLRIASTLVRYRLDDLVEQAHLFRPLRWLRPLLPRPRTDIAQMPRGARLRLALVELGPIFVKFGQILSTRRDLLPTDVADELSLLQDQVPPFPGTQARAAIEAALGAPVATLYRSFDETPLASASIAQVHAAQLADSREVVVKVLRPGIHERIAADVELLHALGKLAQRWHPAADKIRPCDIVAEIETTLHNELDLQREGANASLLRRNFPDGDDVVVPEVFWSHTTDAVLTLERVRGFAVDDLAAIDAAGIDRVALAEKGVRLFYTQVFRDNFFHADAHPGNIWVDPQRPRNPRFIALDFGIMGSLPERDQFWLAENFMALFERDYKRIAELHVAAGWMPAHVRIDELEAAVRTVCEPYFTRPLSQISLAEVVIKLFSVARRYELTLQPQLILLQKTLLNIEGVGRTLHPDIDIWATAKPVLSDILRRRYGVLNTLREFRARLPAWIAAAPEMPDLVRTYLKKAAAGDFDAVRAAEAQAAAAQLARETTRSRILALAGAALLVAASVLYVLDANSFRLGNLPLSAFACALGGAAALAAAWRRARCAVAAPLDILPEDEDLLAVAKPAGLLVHRSGIAADETDFLVERLRAQTGAPAFLAHRLDRATSGVVLLAKSRAIAGELGREFMERRVVKRYLAVVRGWPEAKGVIDYALPAALGRPWPPRHLGSCPADVRERGPRKPALTRWRVLGTAAVPIALGRYAEQRYALVEALPETGRYRQIRKHFHHVSHPVVGDTSHGRGDHNRLWRIHFGVHRLLLHARQLELRHPRTGAPLTLTAPLDATWRGVLQRFGWLDAVPDATLTAC